MTLTQLEAFVLVAKLGSVKAAATALGVSEPAVSQALAALRQHLGDPLVVRTPNGMDLTAGGQRVVGIASQIVNLAVDAEAAIRQAQGAPELLRVVATGTVAEFVAPPLLAAFTSRSAAVETTIGVASNDQIAALLEERLADVALGPRLAGLDSEPLLRYRLEVVASPAHPLARSASVALSALAGSDWLVGSTGADPSSEIGALLQRLGVDDQHVHVFSSDAAAWAAAADGHGVAPAISHLVAPELRRGTLARLPVEGTPIDLLWYITTLPASRRSPAATKLRRFVATPDATHAMHKADGSVPPSRFRPPVYVTIWN